MTSPTPLTMHHRERSLQRMADETVDVLVIGGGITGAGVALDAATRGLKVALVEQRDYAAGTSSRSTKLIHGGLRYLEQLNFGLVREALLERSLMLRTLCPHLVRPVPFLFPLTHRVWERFYIGSGVMLYDIMAGRQRAVPAHRHLSKRKALKVAPALDPEALVGAIQYYDAQVDDARHTMMVARTAATYGAALATSARVTGLLFDGDRVVGAQVHDLETDARIEARARHVINATGIWTDYLNEWLGGQPQFAVRPSKGIHLLVPRDRIDFTTGLIMRTEKSVLFVVPWGNHWVIGTTDTDWDLDRAHPAAGRHDIDYLLERINALLTVPLSDSDIEGVYAGLRPLVAQDPAAGTAQLSREHLVVQPAPGVTVIAGGKYTTYRVMAADAVDAAARVLGGAIPDSVTRQVRIVGADGYAALRNSKERLAREGGLPVDTIDHLLGRYGSLTSELLDLIAERPELAEPIDDTGQYLKAEIHYAASAEAALHLEDVLDRRTRITFAQFDRGVNAAEAATQLVGDVLGWDDDTRRREVDYYVARIDAEREAQRQTDDQKANAALASVAGPRAGAA